MSTTTPTPRIAPGDRSEVGTLNWLFAQISGRVTGTRPPNLFLTLGRQPKLLRGWLRFAARLMPGGTLPRRETELVILRVAQRTGCAYEREHHRHLGRRAGLTEAELDRVCSDDADDRGDDDAWSPRERALLAAADQLLTNHDLDDDSWKTLRTHLDEPTTIEFLLLVAHYEMLATTINTLRIQPDQRRRP